jgi:hypothetical protein
MMKKLPDPTFEHEFDAAKLLGFDCLLFSEEVLSREGAQQAISHLPDGNGASLLYRGWIFSEENYERFYNALADRGYQLVSNPKQYAEVIYFPNYYPKIIQEGKVAKLELTPPAVWTDTADEFSAWSKSRTLGDGPFVLKDHIKSAKHRWKEACFVPKGAGREQFEEIAATLKAEQGSSFHRGFVIKQYIALKSRGYSPREYPMSEEYRLFFWHGRLLIHTHYHNQEANILDLAPFEQLALKFNSPFFTMDITQTESGQWLVMDMGAGECSALPPSLSANQFCERLKIVTED